VQDAERKFDLRCDYQPGDEGDAVSFSRSGLSGTLEVSGKLTIKGKTTEVSFPMSVKKEGAVQIFEGNLPIRRLTFNIGDGEWKDTSVVADEVVIRFRVIAKP
jgi:polyisoprenoid-binding protein YceI